MEPRANGRTWWERLSAEKKKIFSSRECVLLAADLCEVLLADEKRSGPRRFTMLAYSGAKVQRWFGDMVIDVAGVEREAKTAMLFEHVDHWPVGVATDHDTKKGLSLSGYMLDTEKGREVCGLSDQGFPWKCSVGVRPLSIENVEEGVEVEVNGQKFKGPIEVWRKSRLFETSFITCSPADMNTAAEVMHSQEAGMDPKNAPKTPETLAAPQTTGGTAGVELEAAIAARLAERRKELTTAFPKAPAFAARMLMEGKTVAESWPLYAQGLEEDLAKSKEAEVLADVKKKAGEQAASRGLGFSTSLAEGTGQHELRHLPFEERARIEVGNDLRLQELFRDLPNGRKGHEIYAAALRFENRVRADGSRLMNSRVVQLAAEAFNEHCDPRFGPLGGSGERLGSWGKAGPDYSTITQKGFLGQFYAGFEQELGGIWAPQVGLMVESNQETETHRWLGFFPALSEWLGGVREDGMPIYSFAITNKLYRASVGIDKNDFKFQKFGLITMRMGEAGAVTAEHWNQLVTTLIEANGACYDGSLFFATNHALGGAAPAAQSNTIDKTTYGALAVADTTNVSELEMARAINVAVPHLQTFKWNNGQPANGGMRRVGIMVPTALLGVTRAALRSERLSLGASNQLAVQDIEYVLIPNPRLTSSVVFYVFRLDCNNKPFILQEPGPPETLWQGPGSYLEWIQHKFGFGIETTRAAGYGAWESSLKVTLG